MTRSLGLAGAPNARDIGGLVTRDGRRTRSGRVFRAGALARLTDDDVAALAELGLATVVDLRDATEIAIAPDRLPEANGIAVHHAPIYDPEFPAFTYISSMFFSADPGAYAELAEEGTPGAMLAIYRWFVTDETASASFATAVRVVADPSAAPVLFHCSVGKDRTGWLTAIVLTVLGVDRATILADYEATNELTAAAQARLIEILSESRPGIDIDGIRPVLRANREYLDAALAEVDRVYGSFDDYLRAGLGLDDGVLAALRAYLLD